MNFLRRLFRRAPPPRVILGDRRSPNDWAPGDLAVCIAESWPLDRPADPKKGEIRRVSAVVDTVGHMGHLSYFLQFEGYGDILGWEHLAFRKVRPAAAGWFERTMKEHKPVEQPERVGGEP